MQKYCAIPGDLVKIIDHNFSNSNFTEYNIIITKLESDAPFGYKYYGYSMDNNRNMMYYKIYDNTEVIKLYNFNEELENIIK